MDAERFRAWQLVRLRVRGPYGGSAWRAAAHIYRDRAINCMEAMRSFQESIHIWEETYAQLEDQRDELLGTMELAWELVDCVSIAAQEGDGAATVDVERARMRQAEILTQMDALLSKVKQYLAARSEATP
jgi:hypothetical protein